MNFSNTTIRRLFATSITFAILIAITPSAAYAGAPVQGGCTTVGGETLELALLIDGSGSIVPADFLLQQNAYVSAINSLIPIDGSVAVTVYQFSTTFQVEYPLTVISSGADKTALTSAISGMLQLGQSTNIGDTIADAATVLTISGNNFDNQIIDVSTDGLFNVGQNPVTAANNAIAAGVEQVNALGIGVSPNFNAGAGSFSVQVSGFAEFEDAIMDKLMQELQCAVAGELLPIDTTALFVSGAAANAVWILPVLAGIAGTGFYLTRSRWNITTEE